jgi:hypothetical protein
MIGSVRNERRAAAMHRVVSSTLYVLALGSGVQHCVHSATRLEMSSG